MICRLKQAGFVQRRKNTDMLARRIALIGIEAFVLSRERDEEQIQ